MFFVDDKRESGDSIHLGLSPLN